VSTTLLAAGTALAPVEQHHLLEARQMQALSFAVHIPLVCFGIAFPSMVLLVESLYLRTGDELSDLGEALDEGDGGPVRGWGRNGDDPQLRDGPPVAELHRHLRQRLRSRICD